MSNQALSFIGRLDKRALVLNEQQEHAFFKRLLGNRGSVVTQKIFGQKRVRDVYVPPRVVDGSSVVMPRN